MESLELELEEGVVADEKASYHWHSEFEKYMKEMTDKKVAGVDSVHCVYSDLWEKYYQTNPTADKYHIHV